MCTLGIQAAQWLPLNSLFGFSLLIDRFDVALYQLAGIATYCIANQSQTILANDIGIDRHNRKGKENISLIFANPIDSIPIPSTIEHNKLKI